MINFGVCNFIFSRSDANWLNCGIEYLRKLRNLQYTIYNLNVYILAKAVIGNTNV